jgi:hypothetical protein
MTACSEQDLEHLLRSRAAEVARPERALAVLDLQRSEQADERPLGQLTSAPVATAATASSAVIVTRARI